MGARSISQAVSLAVLAVALGAGVGSAEGQGPANCKSGNCGHAAKKKGGKRPPKIEKLACRLGTEDEHARIAVELRDGRVSRFAYYSKWKPRTCSMEVERGDAFSKWEDNGDVIVVTLIEDKGAFLIDHEPNRYHFIFREIDRMRYCGMEGKVSGSLTIFRGQQQCVLEGVMNKDGAPQSADDANPAPKPPASKETANIPAASTASDNKPAGVMQREGDAKEQARGVAQPAQSPASAVESVKPAGLTEPVKKPEAAMGKEGNKKEADGILTPPPPSPAGAVEGAKPAGLTEPVKKPEAAMGKEGNKKEADEILTPPPSPASAGEAKK